MPIGMQPMSFLRFRSSMYLLINKSPLDFLYNTGRLFPYLLGISMLVDSSALKMSPIKGARAISQRISLRLRSALSSTEPRFLSFCCVKNSRPQPFRLPHQLWVLIWATFTLQKTLTCSANPSSDCVAPPQAFRRCSTLEQAKHIKCAATLTG